SRIPGAGILVARGGQVFDAMAPASGTLASVAAIGTKVEKGEVVAALDDTQLGQNLAHARTVLREQEDELAALIDRFDKEIAARRRATGQTRKTMPNIPAAAEQRRAFYTESLRVEEPVAAKGFLTRRFVQDTRQQAENAEEDIRKARSDLLRLDAEE